MMIQIANCSSCWSILLHKKFMWRNISFHEEQFSSTKHAQMFMCSKISPHVRSQRLSWIQVLNDSIAVTATKKITKTILETCDILDTDYNYENWASEFMTIFLTWQIKVTLDSICNFCNVLSTLPEYVYGVTQQ